MMQVSGIAIIIAILVVIPCIALAIRKLMRGKRKRQHFSDSVKESILRKQNKCAQCKRILNVVDRDHKDGDRSNNNKSNCQAHVLIVKL
jgi:hypothetical protein